MSKFLERRTPSLTKKRSVLDYDYKVEPSPESGFPFPPFVVFSQANEGDPEQNDATHSFPLADWEAMGKPEVITVTLEPGDLLNQEPGA